MSSHHFVKEGQEPALLIIQPDGFEQVSSLLEWAPLVVVAEQALEEVMTWGIKIDAVICQTGSPETLLEKLTTQQPVKIISDGEISLTEVALAFLVDSHQKAVNIVTSDDPSFLDRAEQFIHRLHISIINGQIRWSAVTSGNFRKWLPSGNRILLKAKSPVVTKNLKEKNTGLEAEQDGFIEISSKTPFWVGEMPQNKE